jgi:hypothetical protein
MNRDPAVRARGSRTTSARWSRSTVVDLDVAAGQVPRPRFLGTPVGRTLAVPEGVALRGYDALGTGGALVLPDSVLPRPRMLFLGDTRTGLTLLQAFLVAVRFALGVLHRGTRVGSLVSFGVLKDLVMFEFVRTLAALRCCHGIDVPDASTSKPPAYDPRRRCETPHLPYSHSWLGWRWVSRSTCGNGEGGIQPSRRRHHERPPRIGR